MQLGARTAEQCKLLTSGPLVRLPTFQPRVRKSVLLFCRSGSAMMPPKWLAYFASSGSAIFTRFTGIFCFHPRFRTSKFNTTDPRQRANFEGSGTYVGAGRLIEGVGHPAVPVWRDLRRVEVVDIRVLDPAVLACVINRGKVRFTRHSNSNTPPIHNQLLLHDTYRMASPCSRSTCCRTCPCPRWCRTSGRRTAQIHSAHQQPKAKMSKTQHDTIQITSIIHRAAAITTASLSQRQDAKQQTRDANSGLGH